MAVLALEHGRQQTDFRHAAADFGHGADDGVLRADGREQGGEYHPVAAEGAEYAYGVKDVRRVRGSGLGPGDVVAEAEHHERLDDAHDEQAQEHGPWDITLRLGHILAERNDEFGSDEEPESRSCQWQNV